MVNLLFWYQVMKNTGLKKVCPCLPKFFLRNMDFPKVLFAWDTEGKYIDPNNQQGVIGWEHLKDADLMLIGTRFRKPNSKDARYITNFLNEGKPIIGIRTSTHAFNGGEKFGDTISYGQFGPLIMGEGWVSHHGRHKVEEARGMIEVKNASHPILKGNRCFWTFRCLWNSKID